MPKRRPVAMFNVSAEDLSDENIESTAQRIFDAMSERRGVYKSRSEARRVATQRNLDVLATVQIEKAHDYRNLVFGWASVAFTKDGTQLHDSQGHLIDVDDLEEMAYNFVLRDFTTGDMHRSEAFGELVESIVFTPEKIEKMGLQPNSLPTAWWVGFRVPPEYHKMVREGKRTMFSIEGTAKLHPVDDSS